MYSIKNQDIGSTYNADINTGKYQNDYEFNRWFIRPRNRAEYAMTYRAISAALQGASFNRCLELGPGPGTWTRLVYRSNPAATFDLVDVSEAMRDQFSQEMRGGENVQYHVADVMTYTVSEPYDLFFSSRAVEYLDDKEGFFKKLSTFIRPGGTGVIITKNPTAGVRKSKKSVHQGQISMARMEELLTQHGFTDVHMRPVVIRIPIISRVTSYLSEYLANKWQCRELSRSATHRVVESYLVTFSQPL